MRFGNSFGISSNFGKMYRENQYPKHEYFGTIFVPSNLTKNRTFFVSRNLPKILPKIPKYSVLFYNYNLTIMVRFRLNLGLNNLKFVHKSISAVESIRSDRFDPIMTDVAYMTDVACMTFKTKAARVYRGK